MPEHFVPVDLEAMRAGYGLPENTALDLYVPLVKGWAGRRGVIVDGVVGYRSTANPDARFDYWMPRTLPSVRLGDVQSVRKGDLDLGALQSVQNAQRRALWKMLHDHDDEHRARFGAAPDDTESTFVARGPLIPIPVSGVLAEGVWREPGRVGWFGYSSETATSRKEFEDWFARLWGGLADEAWLTMVDCHI